MRRHLLPLLQALVTIGLLAWIFRDERLRKEVASISKMVNWKWVIAGLFAGGLNELAGALRWWCCVRLVGLPVSFARAAALHFMGLFATLFLPGSAGGDAVKIAWLAAEFPQRKIGGVLAALVDRLSGLVAMTILAVLIAWKRRDWFAQAEAAGSLFRAVMWFFAIALVLLVFWGITSRPWFRHRHPPWLPFREKIIEITGVFDTFFSDWRRGGAAIGLSFVTFTSLVLTYFCAAHALALPVPFTDLFSLMPVVDVVTMLPISFSGIGLREKAFETLLSELCGIPGGGAVLVSLTGFGLYACWSLLGAPVFLLYRTRSTKEVPHA